jgi:hypothetical protein
MANTTWWQISASSPYDQLASLETCVGATIFVSSALSAVNG